MDKAHRQTDFILAQLEKDIDRLFTKGHVAAFDELNLPLLYLSDEPEATQRQRLRFASRDGYMEFVIAMIVMLIAAATLQSFIEVGKKSVDIYKLNYKAIADKYGLALATIGEPRFKTEKVKKDIAETAQKRIEKAIKQGHDPNELILDVKREFRKYKSISQRISRTLATRYENMARIDALRAAGIKYKRWQAILDRVTRDSHRRLHNEVKPIGEPFSNGLQYPAQDGGSAEEVMNCRCYIIGSDGILTQQSSDKNVLQDKQNNDIISGALNPDSKLAKEHAEIYYEAVRKMNNDYIKIAKNTGIEESDVKSIKEYLFLQKHNLASGHKRFDADYHIAQSWQRLVDGKAIKGQDLILLKHELMEMRLVKSGLTQNQAHIQASKEFNYKKAVERGE